MPTYYITKFALSSGIREVTVDKAPAGKFLALHHREIPVAFYHYPDWHTTREAAVARAEEMRAKKIKSLKRSIARLEALRFEVKEREDV